MPRNKSLLTKGGTRGTAAATNRRGPRSNTRGSKRIVIRPYQKPPTLPANFYEETVQTLLEGTLSVLKNASSTTTTTTTSHKDDHSNLSLQNAYTAVVHLVSHQYGPRLYQDLRASMQEAARRVLPDNMASPEDHVVAGGANYLLGRLPVIYQSYTDYLLCVKHVFLPLDRTHLWQQQGVVEQQSLWQVGLAVFAQRLAELGLDRALYQEWLQALLEDWNPSSGGGRAMRTTFSSSSWNRSDLQAVWYMWQDLGLLSLAKHKKKKADGTSTAAAVTRLPLQEDLQEYWKNQASVWMAERPYRAAAFLDFLYDKHQHVHQWAPWLPTTWLWSILDKFLLEPHLLTPPPSTPPGAAFSPTAQPGEYLLNPQHLDPLLQEAVAAFQSNKHVQPVGATTPQGSSANSAPTTMTATTGDATTSSIAKLWMLAGRLPSGQTSVAAAVARFARTAGLERVNRNSSSGTPSSSPKAGSKDGVAIVADLLQLQEALAALIRYLPAGKDVIQLKSVWEEVVNQDSITPSFAESLAKFLDQILRSNKKMDQYQQEAVAAALRAPYGKQAASSGNSVGAGKDLWLSKIISGLFIPLQAKDVFEAFYKKDLAKRLLWNRTVSTDVERQVCSLLKAECGAGYTSKMEGILQDVDWSRETMNVYKQSTGYQPSSATNAGSLDMEVQVLTTGYWPVYPQYPNLQLPDPLKERQEHFANHYKTKYQGRRMTWQYFLGHCVVKCNGLSRTYELVVSLCQALVLLQFNNDSRKRWTLPALMQAIGLEDRDDMERIMLSLSLGKEGTRILRKRDFDADPAKRKKIRSNVDDRDEFEIFEGFESNQRRIRINNIMMKETKEEREKTVEAVSRDRLYLIDAVLVRIMKARKTITHQNLIPQVLEHVKVPAQPSDVKKRIESLIEREYMERDPKDRNRYNYLA